MRIRMVSALCVFLPLIYSPRPAAAQFNSSLPPMPQAFARKLPSPGKLSELQPSAGYRGVGTDAELRRRLRSLSCSGAAASNGLKQMQWVSARRLRQDVALT